MDVPLSPTSPAKLYAFQLKLRPLQEGTLMPFSGELVHAAWLGWLGSAAPEVASWLHEGNKRRLFTCSSLQFPFPATRMCDAERENVHMPLTPEKTYCVRITLLLGELFPLFYNALTDFKLETMIGAKKPPFMQLGKQQFLLEEVVADSDNASGWTGFTLFDKLAEKARTIKLGRMEPLTLEFASLTTFNRSNERNRIYGPHPSLLPLPQYVFPGLARRWQELAPPELAGMVQGDLVEQYALDDGIIIADYNLKPHTVKFTTHWQQGFVGKCKYHLRGPDEATTDEAPLTVRQQILLLAQLAFYCGVGYKTSMGMGRTRPV
jgi:CRISPR-associated endoribonuclease Cas6